MRTYEDFAEHLLHGKSILEPGRPIANNTRVYVHEEDAHLIQFLGDRGREGVIRPRIVIRLHATEILTFWMDGTVDLSLSGWQSRVTMDRINEFSKLSIWTWRPKRNYEPVTVVHPEGACWRRHNDDSKRDRRYVMTDYHAYETVRFAPNKVENPRVYGTANKLSTVTTYTRKLEDQLAKEKAAKKRETARRRKIRDMIYKVARYRDSVIADGRDALRELMPEYEDAEKRVAVARRDVDQQRFVMQKRLREMERKLSIKEVEKRGVEESLEALKNELRVVAPKERQRIVLLE